MQVVSLKFLLVNSVYIIVGCFLTYLLLEDDSISIKQILLTFVFGLSIVSVYAIINYAKWGFLEGSNAALPRPFYKDHTIFSAMLAMVFPLGFYVLSIEQSKTKRHWTIAWIAMILLTILFSSSRAAWISVIVAWLIFFMMRFGLKLHQLFFLLLLLISLIVYNFKTIEGIVMSNRNDSNRFQ
jgi:hypothetical protein